jgi:Predicted nucleoside-diphosphate sugar epimerases
MKITHQRIEDMLLGRVPIAIDTRSIGENLKGKVVMVTGAAGSIGSEIVRQLSLFDVRMIILCDNAETPLYNLCVELDEEFPKTPYLSKLCNVQDYNQMRYVILKYKPDYIYHAAAYKHVPLMEDHPCEAVLTNVLGSKNIIDLAVENQVEAFVMISTDKAVNPTSVMGATKRIAEIYIQSLYQKLKNEQKNPTRLITTRFGNVLNSSGSVIPLFMKQIENGGPITVTHKDVIRYFITIREACRLVLEAGNMGKGGEVYLFDMGDSIKITDLAERMIRLAGLEPYKDIDIVFTKLRPGEKLYEELLYDKEKVQPTHNPKILIGTVGEYDFDAISAEISELIQIAYSYDKMDVVRKMKKIVPEFISQNSIYSVLDAVVSSMNGCTPK